MSILTRSIRKCIRDFFIDIFVTLTYPVPGRGLKQIYTENMQTYLTLTADLYVENYLQFPPEYLEDPRVSDCWDRAHCRYDPNAIHKYDEVETILLHRRFLHNLRKDKCLRRENDYSFYTLQDKST